MKKLVLALALSSAINVYAANVQTDVVVIGSGGAGLSSAVTLHDLGDKVIVLEKMNIVGGNTNRAEGGINAAETPQQKKAGIPDTVDQFFSDTMKGGHDINDARLVRTMTTHAKDSIAWLESLGADLSVVGRAGGAKYNRAHRPSDGSAVGPMIMKTLYKAAQDRKLDIRKGTQALDLVKNKAGAVVGV